MIIKPLGDRVVVERMEESKGYLPDHFKRDDLVQCKVIKTSKKSMEWDDEIKEGTVTLIPINALRAVSIAEEKIFIVEIKNINALCQEKKEQ